MLDETGALVRGVTQDAGLAAADVGAVVYTGGSSAIPSFRALMRELLPNAATRDAPAFTSVAAGLAMPGVTEAAITR
jgi:molecular chaperone DnaK (HSP70)